MLNDKVVVITGGAGLLGRNFSQAVAAQGGIAIVADVNLPVAQEVVAKIAAKYAGRADAMQLDITDKASVDILIDSLHAKYGRIDAVVNNAYPRNANFGRQFEDIEYAAIKSGILHFSRYLAQYLKGKGIRVNCLSPGGILDRQPESFLEAYKSYCNEKGMLDPQDISNTLVFLLSDASRYITGQNLVVDDGFTL